MEIPDDEFQPAGPAPAAVVRRRGESHDQMQYRKQGYSDEQTGYSSSASSRGGMGNPLERSYRIALAKEREARMQESQAIGQLNFEREQTLKEKKFAAEERIQAAAQQDEDEALNQATQFLDEQDQLAQKFGRGSRQYMLSALSLARKYPVAVMRSQRIGEQLSHYDKILTNAGVSDEVKMAMSEIGQADASQPDMLGYLDTIPAKYPEIVNDPQIMGIFNTKRKEAAAAQLKRENPQLQPARATIETAGGNLTLEDPKAEKDTVLPSLEREAARQARFLDRAKRIRSRSKPEDVDIIRDTDADIVEAEGALAEIESQIRSRRVDSDPKEPGQAATAPATTIAEFESADEFKSAFASAAPGSVITYRGKKYTKPQGAQ